MPKAETFQAEQRQLEWDEDNEPGENIPITMGAAIVAEVLGSDEFPCLNPEDSDELENHDAVAFGIASEIVKRWNCHNDALALAERIAEALEGSCEPQAEVWCAHAKAIIAKAGSRPAKAT